MVFHKRKKTRILNHQRSRWHGDRMNLPSMVTAEGYICDHITGVGIGKGHLKNQQHSSKCQNRMWQDTFHDLFNNRNRFGLAKKRFMRNGRRPIGVSAPGGFLGVPWREIGLRPSRVRAKSPRSTATSPDLLNHPGMRLAPSIRAIFCR